MGHLDIEAVGKARDPAPFGRAAAPARIEIADIDGAGHHQIAAAGAADLALPGADGNAGLAARRGHVEAVAVPAHRLLEPADVLILHEARELDGLAQRPALIGVHRQDEIGARRLARDLDPLGILRRAAAADLELAAGIARTLDPFHLAAEIGQGLSLLVIAGDADDRE